MPKNHPEENIQLSYCSNFILYSNCKSSHKVLDFTVKPRGYKKKLQNVSNKGRKNKWGGGGGTQPKKSAFGLRLVASSGTPAKSIAVYIRTDNAVFYHVPMQ
jgi:hypothetical protein